MKETARAYDRLSAVYDERWRHYLDETLSWVSRQVEARWPARLLDVGCGTGELIRRLKTHMPETLFVGLDPSAGMLGRADLKFPKGEGRTALLQAPAERIPMKDSSFDWVTCVNSLHCLEAPDQAIGEMARVLRPEGKLLLIDWSRESWLCQLLDAWCRRFDPTHVAMYRPGEVKQMLERAGLSLLAIEDFRVGGLAGLRLWEMMSLTAVKPASGMPASSGLAA